MNAVWFVLLALLANLSFAEDVAEPEVAEPVYEVVSLTEDSFRQAVEGELPLLVMFYAPWCSHCKNMAPKIKQLPDIFKDKVIVADIDCDAETQLCGSNGVRGYPTIRLFNHKVAYEYQGRGDVEDLSSWVEKMLMPFYTSISRKSIRTITDPIYFLLRNPPEGAFDTIEQALGSLRGIVPFYYVKDEQVSSGSSLTSYREGLIDRQYDFGLEVLLEWIPPRCLALLPPISPFSINILMRNENKRVAILAYAEGSKDEEAVLAHGRAMAKRKDLTNLQFASLNTVEYTRFAEMHLAERRTPAWIVMVGLNKFGSWARSIDLKAGPEASDESGESELEWLRRVMEEEPPAPPVAGFPNVRLPLLNWVAKIVNKFENTLNNHGLNRFKTPIFIGCSLLGAALLILPCAIGCCRDKGKKEPRKVVSPKPVGDDDGLARIPHAHGAPAQPGMAGESRQLVEGKKEDSDPADVVKN